VWIELAREKHARAFKISFVRRSSNTSRRSLRISSRSSLLSRSVRRPSFASTWRTYFRNVSDGNPKSAATCATGRPDSNTNRVARSNNSTGYFLDLGTTDLSFHQADPGNEVSVKPGMAQAHLSRLGCGEECAAGFFEAAPASATGDVARAHATSRDAACRAARRFIAGGMWTHFPDRVTYRFTEVRRLKPK